MVRTVYNEFGIHKEAIGFFGAHVVIRLVAIPDEASETPAFLFAKSALNFIAPPDSFGKVLELVFLIKEYFRSPE